MSAPDKLTQAAAEMRFMMPAQRVAIACAASSARSAYVNLGRADSHCVDDRDRAEKVEQAWRAYHELGDWLRKTGVESPQAPNDPKDGNDDRA